MCLKLVLSLKRKRWYLLVLALFLIISLSGLTGFIYLKSSYNINVKKLTEIKSREDRFRSRISEEGYKEKLQRTILEVEELESIQKPLYVGYISCAVICVIFLLLSFLIVGCREALIRSPRFENFFLMCTIKECSPCKKPECCSGSDEEEDTISQIARDVSASFDRTAPESVVFRGTRNTEGGAGQEASANLPGVPSTSNN